MHAASQDEEDSKNSEMELMAREGVVLVHLAERSDLPFIGAREGGERLLRELKGTREMRRTDNSRRVQRLY